MAKQARRRTILSSERMPPEGRKSPLAAHPPLLPSRSLLQELRTNAIARIFSTALTTSYGSHWGAFPYFHILSSRSQVGKPEIGVRFLQTNESHRRAVSPLDSPRSRKDT